jgi:hydroxymethylbilane synthase
VTARLAIHDDVAGAAADVLARLATSGVDVEVLPAPDAAPEEGNPLVRLIEEHLDLAVVGVRALRGTATDRLAMLAVLPREDPRDVVVTVAGERAPLASLPRRARVAVAGPRRTALLRAHRPDVDVVVPGTELDFEALERDGVHSAILWSGEVRRAGLTARTAEVLDARSWPPEPGQGAVAIMGRHPIAEVTALDHLPTRTALRAELALIDALDAPEDAGLGSLAQPSGRIMRMWAAVASVDGRQLVRADLTGPLDEPAQLGLDMARALTARGAELVLAGSAG